MTIRDVPSTRATLLAEDYVRLDDVTRGLARFQIKSAPAHAGFDTA